MADATSATIMRRAGELGKRTEYLAFTLAKDAYAVPIPFISEILTVKGAVVAGALPAELDNANTYTGAVHVRSVEKEAAAELLAALGDPAGRSRWTAAGLEPAF